MSLTRDVRHDLRQRAVGLPRSSFAVVAAVEAALLVAVLLTGVFAAGSRGTRTVTLHPAADSYVSAAHPLENYGRRPVLRVDAAPKIHSYLTFDLPQLRPRTARLRVFSQTDDSVGFDVGTTPATWSETALSYRDAPAPTSATVSSGALRRGAWSSVDVSSLVPSGGRVTFVLTTRSRTGISVESREGREEPQLVVTTGGSGSPPPQESLTSELADVGRATGVRYAVKDDRGRSMDTLTVAVAPSGGYLGVYHVLQNNVLSVELATSTDLRSWTWRRTLDVHASQPSLFAVPSGGFLLADEADSSNQPAPRTWVRLRFYPTLASLLAGQPGRTFDAPRSLGVGGAEGTPSIYTATLNPDLAHSTVTVGFHYLAGGVDREAVGRLDGFSRWSAAPDTALDAALSRAGADGKHGDRTSFQYQGGDYLLVEAQSGSRHEWHVYLYDRDRHTARQVQIRTKHHSRQFANPSVTLLPSPHGHGRSALVVTLFLPTGGAKGHEAGELLYYRDLSPGTVAASASDPVVVAAGDIACLPDKPQTAKSCAQQATADLVAKLAPTRLLALGDLQYERGAADAFTGSYDRSWGRFKAITSPAVGNHEYGTPGASAYFSYFGAAAGPAGKGYYSFDLGSWHLIALNSQCREVGGCGPGSPQERWLAADLAAHPNTCVLAYWHKPRFSSGVHGDDPEFDAFWRDLYAAHADIVLNGHDHDYERFVPQDPRGLPDAHGITEFVVGTGGKNHDPIKTIRPNSAVRNAGAFGALQLTLHPGGYDWRFVPAAGGAGGAFTDSGSAACS